MPKKTKRCPYCYKRLTTNSDDHYYSGVCVKARETTKSAKPPKTKKQPKLDTFGKF